MAALDPITLRPLEPADIPLGMRLCAAAGWNQSAQDWAALLRLSAGASFAACHNGVEAGTVTTVCYPGGLNWIGMVLVAPEYRRLGIGKRLLNAALAAAAGRGVLGLDATPAGRPLYESLGFTALYPLARWLRPSGPAPSGESACRPLDAAALAGLAGYDREVFGADRTPLLADLARRAPDLAFVTADAGQPRGYCLGRRGRLYTQIGPLAAPTLADARELLRTALRTCAGEALILDIPFHRPEWHHWLKELGFSEQRPFTRMRLGDWTLPDRHADQLAIAGPEFG
jgi:GNAT superfamily N-acetyltransferase